MNGASSLSAGLSTIPRPFERNFLLLLAQFVKRFCFRSRRRDLISGSFSGERLQISSTIHLDLDIVIPSLMGQSQSSPPPPSLTKTQQLFLSLSKTLPPLTLQDYNTIFSSLAESTNDNVTYWKEDTLARF